MRLLSLLITSGLAVVGAGYRIEEFWIEDYRSHEKCVGAGICWKYKDTGTA